MGFERPAMDYVSLNRMLVADLVRLLDTVRAPVHDMAVSRLRATGRTYP